MMRSLRVKFAFSHILPILLLSPLLSLYLLYSLEEFFTQKLLQQLAQQAHLLFDQVQQNLVVVEEQATAQRFLAKIAPQMNARVLLIDKDGTILASTRSEDAGRIGRQSQDANVRRGLQGETVQGIGPGFTTEVAYVVTPIKRDAVTIGVLRLSYEVDDVRKEFNQVRRLVLGGIALTVLLGLGLAIGLAVTITNPLHELSKRVQDVASGNYQARVTIMRQDEVGILAQNFNQMATRLEEAEFARQQQLAAIVHELARPLTGMRAAIETLLDGAEADAEVRHLLLGGIAEESARLERLIQTLQDVQRRGLKPLQLNRALVSLERIVRASVAHFEPVAAQLGIALSVTIPPRLPRLQADEDRLIQVLINLLDNALKFTERGGRVAVTVSEHAQALQVAVEDNGIGIAPHELPNVFQQFYRGDEGRVPEKQGMGLGLTISREIVAAHGGQIWVESTPHQGTCFTFTLPKRAEE